MTTDTPDPSAGAGAAPKDLVEENPPASVAAGTSTRFTKPSLLRRIPESRTSKRGGEGCLAPNGMGFMLRVRLASFFAGATAAAVAGGYFLYKDYKLAHDSMALQVRAPPLPPHLA
jgi:hypothetical protein